MRDLSRLLRPRSIAVVGGAWAENVVEQCLQIGFGGPVWPVHPTRRSMHSIPCYRDLGSLPAVPDAVFLGVNPDTTYGVVAELSRMGAGGAVCFSAGWAEAGHLLRQAALVEAAGDMAILGPNGYGFLNYLDGAAIWPDQHGGRRVETGVAIISQSSNVAITLTMQRRGLPIAYVICLGNAAQTGLADLCRAVLKDRRVSAIGIVVEGIGDAPSLTGFAAEARATGRAIVALKSGRSEAGARAAASHSASLSGDGSASRAFLAQAGIGAVETLPALIEALKILHVHGPLTGRRVCSLACSGGEAGMMADLADGGDLSFAPPEAATATRLAQELGPLATIANPLDYQTAIWGDREKIARVSATMLADYDAGLFVIDLPRDDRCDLSSFTPALRAIGDAQRIADRPLFPVSTIPESWTEAMADDLLSEGIVPLGGMETGLAALAAATAPAARPGWRPIDARPLRQRRALDEYAAKTMLREAGLILPRGHTAPDLASLDTSGLSPPFVLKGLGPIHKTEVGAVRLGLSSLEGQVPMEGVVGYIVEEMVENGLVEMIVGLHRDPIHGVVLVIGMGGVAAELLDDIATLIVPVTSEEILAALTRLRFWPMLNGYRGRVRPDIQAALTAIEAIQSLALSHLAVAEIEVNPLMLRAADAIVADAVIWVEDP